METVPFVAFESVCTRLERNNRRLFIICIALLVALLATNIGWIAYEAQYQTVSYEQEVQQEATENGNNVFVGGDAYGDADSQNED